MVSWWEHLVLKHVTKAGACRGDFLGLLKNSPFHFYFFFFHFRHQSTDQAGALLNLRVSLPSTLPSALPSASSLPRWFLDGRIWAWWPRGIFCHLLSLVFRAVWPSSPSLCWLERKRRWCWIAELVCQHCHWVEQTVNDNYEIFPINRVNILLLPARLVSHHNISDIRNLQVRQKEREKEREVVYPYLNQSGLLFFASSCSTLSIFHNFKNLCSMQL